MTFTDYMAPRIDIEGLSPDDQDVARWIEHALWRILSYLQNFEAAVTLFDFATERHKEWVKKDPIDETEKSVQELLLLSRWHFIAARDGAITIFHFGKSLEGIRAELKKCSSLNALIDQTLLSESTKELRKHFPRFEAIRHAIAHEAEFAKNQAARDEHKTLEDVDIPGYVSLSPKCADYFGGLHDRTLVVTFENALIGYEISRQTADRLKAIMLKFFSAFQQASY